MDRDLVMGRFRLGERIGSGGMGIVYRAFDERLGRDVAVKEIPAGDPDRVLREAQAAARLNHPGIATLYELGRRGSSAVLVFELVRGPTLAEVRACGAISDRDVAEIGIELCEAIAHAHAAGVVHRDVKPQNVIVCEDAAPNRRAKLMDFGIARLAGAPTLTATGEVVGTLAYMAPEQSDGLEAGPEADVYSLALTLYECWAAHNPVAGPTPAATVRRIGMPVPSLAHDRPDLDEGLVDAVDACLIADPEQRPSANDLRAALEAARAKLDASDPVPSGGQDGRAPRWPRLGVARLVAVLATSVALAAVWGPLGAPGAALVAAVLLIPAIIALPGLGPLVPPLGALLGALALAGAFPAAAAHAGRTALQRAIAGALGWCWALAVAIGLGAGQAMGIAPRAAAGWESSAGDAGSELLVVMLQPGALAGIGIFALAAAILGWVLAARQIAVAALGVLIWAALLVAALGAVADGSLGERGIVIALAGAGSVVYEQWRRGRRSSVFARAYERGMAVPHGSEGAASASAGLRA
jgi:eukaryotic-like serine/threonine-protein kinase